MLLVRRDVRGVGQNRAYSAADPVKVGGMASGADGSMADGIVSGFVFGMAGRLSGL